MKMSKINPQGKEPSTTDHLERNQHPIILKDSDLHYWFGLSYANYLCIPRSLLQSMPIEWQDKLATLLREADEIFTWPPQDFTYTIYLRNKKGIFVSDPMKDYRHSYWTPESVKKLNEEWNK